MELNTLLTKVMHAKRGAMFGLDARIALAIFGALSVISGAALYSAIQNAKVTTILTILESHSKAVEAYMLDTGQNVPADVEHGPDHLQIAELIKSSVPGWKGPYLSYSESTLDLSSDWDRFDRDASGAIDGKFYLLAHLANGWTTSNLTDCTGAAGEGCYYWMLIEQLKGVDLSLIKQLDLLVDGVYGNITGKIRYIDYDTDGDYHLYLMGPKVL